ncbi:MAG: response regulator transcription factor [Actinomycetota bacterium]|nr:response regulator transcription factor [Actinomycetota bacterium]
MKLGRLLCLGLAKAHFKPTLASTGKECLEASSCQHFAAMVLDLGLPDISGLEVCRILRQRGRSIPILMLTAASSPPQRVVGLNAGADDYLGKPFDFAELVARIQALVRRTVAHLGVIRVGDLEIDLPLVEVRRAGVRIQLRPQEFRVLAVLANHVNTTVSRRTMIDEAWDWALEPPSNLPDAYVAILRAKIDHPFQRHSIRTVRGFGYALTEG